MNTLFAPGGFAVMNVQGKYVFPSLFRGKHKRPVSGADLFGGLKNNFVSAIV